MALDYTPEELAELEAMGIAPKPKGRPKGGQNESVKVRHDLYRLGFTVRSLDLNPTDFDLKAATLATDIGKFAADTGRRIVARMVDDSTVRVVCFDIPAQPEPEPTTPKRSRKG